jgi:WD40 repeat protein
MFNSRYMCLTSFSKKLRKVFFYLYASDMILQSGNQPAVLVWDCSTMSFVSELKGHLYGVECITFSPNG